MDERGATCTGFCFTLPPPHPTPSSTPCLSLSHPSPHSTSLSPYLVYTLSPLLFFIHFVSSHPHPVSLSSCFICTLSPHLPALTAVSPFVLLHPHPVSPHVTSPYTHFHSSTPSLPLPPPRPCITLDEINSYFFTVIQFSLPFIILLEEVAGESFFLGIFFNYEHRP